mgnify:CR=1 FL=1
MIESKNKWNLIGDTFAGDACATHGKESKYVDWLRDMSSSTTFHIDQGLFQPVLSPKQQSYGWILESEAIIPEVYANAPRVLKAGVAKSSNSSGREGVRNKINTLRKSGHIKDAQSAIADMINLKSQQRK